MTSSERTRLRSRSRRLTTPTSSGPSITGTQRTSRSSITRATSDTSSCGDTATTSRVMTSATTCGRSARGPGPPSGRGSRSLSLTIPTTSPAASTTGREVIFRRVKSAAARSTGSSGRAVYTGRLITSIALIRTSTCRDTRSPYRSPTRQRHGGSGSELAHVAGAATGVLLVHRYRRSGVRAVPRQERQHLPVLRAVAVDGDALDPLVPRLQVDVPHVRHGRLRGQVHGLGHRRVGVLLEGRLHPQVPLRGDLEGGDEGPADVRRHRRVVPDPAGTRDPGHELVPVEAPLPRETLEQRVDLGQPATEHVADVGDHEHRLDAGAGARDDGDRAGGRDRHQLGVALRWLAAGRQLAVLPGGEGTALAGEVPRRLTGLAGNR